MSTNVGDEIRKKGMALLDEHRELQKKLIEIPWKRAMNVRWEKNIAKPRFEEPYRPLDGLVEVLNHLQNIWDFLSHYYYYFDEKVISFIHKDTRRSEKSSIIFLLEHDVWETDEVYGDYLVENKANKLEISYYRRKQKRKTKVIPLLQGEQLDQWLMDDAREQIRDVFLAKWELLELEIKTCMECLHIRPVSEPLTNKELLEQLKMGEKLINDSPEIAMLTLGWISEIWGILALKQKEKQMNQHLLTDLLKHGKVDDSQKKLLNEIRILYNSVKHKADFQIKQKEVRHLYSHFRQIFLK